MAALGPFERAPRLAVAVSGGGDSTALALLADAWVRAAGGAVLALIVDHGLRRESADEAATTAARLLARGIASRILTLDGLRRGSGLAERARAARYEALRRACARAGIVHLLLGHHAADQAETLAMRLLAGSHAAGLAGMAALVETPEARLLRPLLAVPPAWLRAVLADAGAGWVDDPSNTDAAAQRSRLRALRRDPDGDGPVTAALGHAAAHRARQRAQREAAVAASLAEGARIRPEGFAVLAASHWSADTVAPLVRALAGAAFAPGSAALATLVAGPAACTVAGTRIMPAGRLGGAADWLLLREAAAMEAPVSARPGVLWDGRFRLRAAAAADATIGALGAAGAAALPRARRRGLPSAVLVTLPAIRAGDAVVAIPHLRWPSDEVAAGWPLVLSPRAPAAPAAFVAGLVDLAMAQDRRPWQASAEVGVP